MNDVHYCSAWEILPNAEGEIDGPISHNKISKVGVLFLIYHNHIYWNIFL